jgi:exodeoxyribonuclease-3
MKIASFNINGIKARINALPEWLDEAQPDVALLQEIKSVDEAYPREIFEDRGYIVEDVRRGLPGDDSDEQARWIEATVVGETEALRICGLYLPNGNPVELDNAGKPVKGGKYAYKLAWMDRLQARTEELMSDEMPFLMAGDYNIIAQPEDAARPEIWEGDAACRPESLAAYRKLVNLGLTDATLARDPRPGQYTFWDYQAGAWNKNNGIRIDHFLLSPACADMLVDTGIDKDIRAREKPSDHVPIWVELKV